MSSTGLSLMNFVEINDASLLVFYRSPPITCHVTNSNVISSCYILFEVNCCYYKVVLCLFYL